MLQVILTILKILLWILLAILGIVLLLILLVLFSPIKYKADIKYHEKAVIDAKISFLIASVRILFEQETKKIEYGIRLAGIKLNLNKKKKVKQVKEVKEVTEVTENADSLADNNDDNGSIQLGGEIVEQQFTQIDTEDSSITDFLDEDMDDVSEFEEFDLFDDNTDKDVPKEQQRFVGRLKAFVSAVKNKFLNIKSKLENFSPENIEQKIETKLTKLKKNVNKFKRFWNLKCTVKTRNYLKKYLVGLIKHIGPRKVKGYVRYGFGDPCKTGQVTGYLSLLPFVYSKHFSLEPDFYDKIIDAELLIKGRFRIGYIIRIVLNINIWRTILVARKIFKGKKNKEV